MIKYQAKTVITCGMLAATLVITTAPCRASKTKQPAISNKKVTIRISEKYRLKVKNKHGKKVVWSTTSKRIAAVSKKGVVTGKKAGKAKIKAKIGKKSLRCRVTVVKKNAVIASGTNNTVSSAVTRSPGSTARLSATQKPGSPTSPSGTPKPSNTARPKPDQTPKPGASQTPAVTGTPSPTKVPYKDSGNDNSIANNPADDSGKDDGWVPGWY